MSFYFSDVILSVAKNLFPRLFATLRVMKWRTRCALSALHGYIAVGDM